MTWLENPRTVLTVAALALVVGFSIITTGVVLLNGALG